jgi:hypothetical protein
MAGQDGLSANLTLGLLLDCRLSPLLAPPSGECSDNPAFIPGRRAVVDGDPSRVTWPAPLRVPSTSRRHSRSLDPL